MCVCASVCGAGGLRVRRCLCAFACIFELCVQEATAWQDHAVAHSVLAAIIALPALDLPLQRTYIQTCILACSMLQIIRLHAGLLVLTLRLALLRTQPETAPYPIIVPAARVLEFRCLFCPFR